MGRTGIAKIDYGSCPVQLGGLSNYFKQGCLLIVREIQAIFGYLIIRWDIKYLSLEIQLKSWPH